MTATVEGCCSGNPSLSFPITIGTYPIQDVIEEQPMLPQPSAPQPSAPQPSAPPTDSKEFTKLPYPSAPSGPSAPSAPVTENDLNKGKYPFVKYFKKYKNMNISSFQLYFRSAVL